MSEEAGIAQHQEGGRGESSPSNELTATMGAGDALFGTHRCTLCTSSVCSDETQPPSFYKAMLQMETTTTGQRVGFYSLLDHDKLQEQLPRLLPMAGSKDGQDTLHIVSIPAPYRMTLQHSSLTARLHKQAPATKPLQTQKPLRLQAGLTLLEGLSRLLALPDKGPGPLGRHIPPFSHAVGNIFRACQH